MARERKIRNKALEKTEEKEREKGSETPI